MNDLEAIVTLLPAALQINMAQGAGSNDDMVIKKAVELLKKIQNIVAHDSDLD